MKSILIIMIAGIISVSKLISSEQYIIYDTHNNEKTNVEKMVEKTKDFDVIFFGEFHDDSLNHKLQADYMDLLFKSGLKPVVSLEMFERDVQKQLDSYLAGELSEEEFLKNSRPWPDYNKFYRVLVELAKENNSQVIAANIPRKYAGMYVNGGMTSFEKLSDEEKSFIAKKMILSEDEYLDKFLETMTGSKDTAKALSANKLNTLYLYYGAQCIKDETMAESILEFHRSNPDRKIVHFNGDFHSNSFLGTVSMLQRRSPKLKIAVITPIYFDDIDKINLDSDLKKQGNFVLYLPQPKREEIQQRMGGPSHFGENFVVEHNINVEIDPSKSFLKGSDKILFKNPVLKSSSLQLLKSLKITKMSSDDNNLKFSIKPIDDYYNEILIENISLKNQSYDDGGIKETFNALIEYEGVVKNVPSEINMVKRHSNTPGIISGDDKEGIYLPGGSYYPMADKDLAKFNMYITLPIDYKLVTSGNIVENPGSKNVIYKVTSDQFLDGITIVAAKYKVIEQIHDSVRFALYYYNEAPHNSKYILASIDYYNYYTKLFGKYPYKSFVIAENFFPTGYGMPNYTLLSNKLTAMPWVTLSPGSLAHEFVHNWWGNSVFVENSTGNWCEALTTFSTNYYFNIITNNQKEALDWRRKALIQIDALPEEKNYPVSEFKYQENTYDAVVGYSKGAFIFEEIRKLIGDEKFFGALKSFAEKFAGKRAYWMNLTSEFVNITKDTLPDIKLRNVINDWLKTKNIPEIRFASNPVFYNDSVTLKIATDIKRVITVPITLNYDEKTGSNKHYIVLKDTLTEITLPRKENLTSIDLDKEFESLRKIYPWEKPFSLNQVLASKPIIVLPDKMSPEFKIAMDYVKTMKESGFDFEFNTLDNIHPDDLKYSSLILLGNTKNNQLIAEYSKQLPKDLKLDESGFSYDGKFTDFKEDVLMANVEHLHSKDKFCTIIYFDGLKEDAPLNRLYHYQSYSLVLLNTKRTGRPIYNCEIFPSSIDITPIHWDKNMESTIRGHVD